MSTVGGGNLYGQLGNNTITDSTTPVVVTKPSGVTFSAITSGSEHSCALTSMGTAYCWGRNYEGQVGNGTVGSAGFEIPTAVTMPAGAAFTQISAGGNHTCALTSSGSAYC
ncbi:MAG: RCC1 domain-containing protein, partial [Roseiflexaceae bacterium]